jgi:tRNA(Ile)-lysidine synthase
MSVDEEWLAAQGEDAALLHFASGAFFFEKPKRIGVAVSGGSDSMAMLQVMARIAPQAGWTIHAVTVDHGLRPESASEAQFVQDACTALGIEHVILDWNRTQTSGNLQDQAARARYRLMAEWAVANSVSHITVGHTADDQAETFIMRLARRSGLDGLAGMRRQWKQDGVSFVRPFLLHERRELRAYLSRNRIGWIEDPSNENDRFDRVKTRKTLVQLKALGISTDVLTDVTLYLSQAHHALNEYCAEIARRILTCRNGDVIFDWMEFRRTQPEVRRRLLIAALRWVSGAEYPPRSLSVAKLEIAIWDRKNRTLSGCKIVCSEKTLTISREPAAVRSAIGPTSQLWDNRWSLDGPHAPGLEIRALGPTGLLLCPHPLSGRVKP